ncbi:MAG: dihydrolipoyl dehydrogenase [Dehalococcoidia bacterium]|nr:dihydrolipoyl dehydrogenase [Dehalococcoidia bacterium]
MSRIITDIAVIGGGPAGYSAAVQAFKTGARVVLLEKASLGGTCLNHGCIPTKTMLHSANLLRSIQTSARFGVVCNNSILDIEKLKGRCDEVISILHSSMAALLEEHKIDILAGKASFHSPYDIEIQASDGSVTMLHAAKIIIASGSAPQKLSVQGGDSPNILYSSDLLELKFIPARLVIIGGGAVGLELAAIMHSAGSQVSVVEIAQHILPYEDKEITSVLERALKRDGIQIHTNSIVHKIESSATAGKVYFSHAGVETALETEAICVCIGQQPEFAHLGLDAAGVICDERGIQVDAYMQTSAPYIYVVGDVTGVGMLAYVALSQGRIAVINVSGRIQAMDYTAIPRCVFTTPEVASVGFDESEALANGIAVRILRSSLASNPYATIQGERRGFVKLVIDAKSGKLLGAQLVGSGAASLISECALAIKLGATARDLSHTLHPHPSLAEALQEAALSDIY